MQRQPAAKGESSSRRGHRPGPMETQDSSHALLDDDDWDEDDPHVWEAAKEAARDVVVSAWHALRDLWDGALWLAERTSASLSGAGELPRSQQFNFLNAVEGALGDHLARTAAVDAFFGRLEN